MSQFNKIDTTNIPQLNQNKNTLNTNQNNTYLHKINTNKMIQQIPNNTNSQILNQSNDFLSQFRQNNINSAIPEKFSSIEHIDDLYSSIINNNKEKTPYYNNLDMYLDGQIIYTVKPRLTEYFGNEWDQKHFEAKNYTFILKKEYIDLIEWR